MERAGRGARLAQSGANGQTLRPNAKPRRLWPERVDLNPSTPDPREGLAATAALRTLRTAPPQVWIALGLLFVFNVGLHWMAQRVGVAVGAPTFAPEMIAYLILQALASSAVAGLLLRLLLSGPQARHTRRGFLAFVGFTAAIDVGSAALMFVAVAGGPAATATPDPASLTRFAVVALGFVGGTYVVTRLLLLPIAWLLDDREVTPGVAWSRMGGHVMGYLGNLIVMSLPPTLLYVTVIGLVSGGEDSATTATVLVGNVFGAIFLALAAGLDAVFYRRRAGDKPAVAATFD